MRLSSHAGRGRRIIKAGVSVGRRTDGRRRATDGGTEDDGGRRTADGRRTDDGRTDGGRWTDGRTTTDDGGRRTEDDGWTTEDRTWYLVLGTWYLVLGTCYREAVLTRRKGFQCNTAFPPPSPWFLESADRFVLITSGAKSIP